MVNWKFYCDVLRRLRENIWWKYPDKWCNNSWALNHDNAPANASLVVQQFLVSKNTTVNPHPPYSLDITLWFFPISEDEIEIQGATFWQQWGDPDQTAKRDEEAVVKYFQKYFRSWKFRWNPCINVKRDYFEGNGANRNFGKWLNYGTGILGTFE